MGRATEASAVADMKTKPKRVNSTSTEQVSPTAKASPKKRRNTIPSGVAIFVDLENVSFLRAIGFRAIAACLRTAHGPIRQLAIYTNPYLVPAVGISADVPNLRINLVDTTRWSVDDILIRDVISQLPHLPETVALVSGDGDFAGLVRQIGASGRKPVVVAPRRNVSSTLLVATLSSGGTYYLFGRNIMPAPPVKRIPADDCGWGRICQTPTALAPLQFSRKRAKPSTTSWYPAGFRSELPQPELRSGRGFSIVRYVASFPDLADHETSDAPLADRPLEQVASLKAR